MSSHGPARRDYITLLAIEPKDGTLTFEVQISFERMQAVGRLSMGHAKECGLIVPMILLATLTYEKLIQVADECEVETEMCFA